MRASLFLSFDVLQTHLWRPYLIWQGHHDLENLKWNWQLPKSYWLATEHTFLTWWDLLWYAAVTSDMVQHLLLRVIRCLSRINLIICINTTVDIFKSAVCKPWNWYLTYFSHKYYNWNWIVMIPQQTNILQYGKKQINIQYRVKESVAVWPQKCLLAAGSNALSLECHNCFCCCLSFIHQPAK